MTEIEKPLNIIAPLEKIQVIEDDENTIIDEGEIAKEALALTEKLK